jgi:hypothetical protein
VTTRIIGIGLASVLATAFALSGGCGGGNPRLSARAYVTETSAVCVHANRAVARIPSPGFDHGVRPASATARLVVIHRQSLDSLRALRPPKDYETTAKVWIALVDQSTDELDAMRGAVRSRDWPVAKSYAQKASALNARSQVIARKYGITPCKLPELTA